MKKRVVSLVLALILLVMTIPTIGVFAEKAEEKAADKPAEAEATAETTDLDRIPEGLREFVVAYIPLEGNYDDVTGNLVTTYFDKESGKIYSTEEVDSSNAVFEEGRQGGYALRLADGTYHEPMASHVQVGEQGEINFDEDFTISVISNEAFTAPYTDYQVLFGNRDWENCDDGNGVLISFIEGYKVQQDVKAGELDRVSYPIGEIIPEDTANDWHMFTMVGSRADGKFYLYIDGLLKAEQEYPDSVGETMMSNQPLRIGTDGEGNFGYYGLIDEAIVFNKALGEEEVAELASVVDLKAEIIPVARELKLYTTKEETKEGNTKLSIEFTNVGDFDKENIEVFLEKLGDGRLLGETAQTIEKLAAGESAVLEFEVKVETGSMKVFATITDDLGTYRKRASFVTTGAAGWISGDIHNHTRYSDGEDTIFDNFENAAQQGIDFVNIADHNNSEGWEEAEKYGKEFGVLAIRGNEYSGDQYTHAIFMNQNEEKDYGSMNPIDAVKEFKEDTKGEGLVYVAHPYDGRLDDNSYDNTTGWDSWANEKSWDAPIDGIEVWNAWYAGNYIVNAEARVKWDALNNEGRHIYGVADTDTHNARYMGEAYQTVLVEDYSVEGIVAAFKAGHMYGSNGPIIDLKAGEAMMGDDVPVAAEGEDITIEMSAEYLDKLAKIILIKNGEVVWSEEIDSESIEVSHEINVKPGDFIRIEVEGVEDGERTHTGPSFDTSAPFAFSNPIFFVESK